MRLLHPFGLVLYSLCFFGSSAEFVGKFRYREITERVTSPSSIFSGIPFHLQLFARKSLKRLLQESGFADIRIYEYNPTSWLPLSIMQWKNRMRPTVKCGHPTCLGLVCYPIGWLAAKFGMGEELVGIGRL